MTPANKGSVIERPVSGREESPPSGPNRAGASSALDNDQASLSAPSDRGAAVEKGVGLVEQFPDGIVGEAVPLQERLIVSPCTGRFQAGARPDKASGEYILEGQEIGRVISSDREVVPVRSAFSGWIMGYLLPEGSPVRVAEPVAWLRPH